MNTKRSLIAMTLAAVSVSLFTLIATTRPLPARAQADLSPQIVSVQSAGGTASHPACVHFRKIGANWKVYMK